MTPDRIPSFFTEEEWWSTIGPLDATQYIDIDRSYLARIESVDLDSSSSALRLHLLLSAEVSDPPEGLVVADLPPSDRRRTTVRLRTTFSDRDAAIYRLGGGDAIDSQADMLRNLTHATGTFDPRTRSINIQRLVGKHIRVYCSAGSDCIGFIDTEVFIFPAVDGDPSVLEF